MLDLKFIRENSDIVRLALKNRRSGLELDGLIELDDKRKKVLFELEGLRAEKNKANDEISKILKEKKDPKERIASMKDIAAKIPHSSIPVGDASVNKVVRTWGEPRKIANPRSHIELAEHLDIIDFNRAAKLTGSNFILYKGEGARLERALYNFMLDLHTSQHGYKEIFPPFLVNRASMTGTG